jgi:phage FluMu gp28-like protein
MDSWYIGYNKDMALEFIRDCAFWSKHLHGFVRAGWEEEKVFEDDDGKTQIKCFIIEFESGYRITALSGRPTNLRGKKGFVIIDEAAFHESLDELLKAAIALLMWPKGRVAIISTYDGVENAFHALVEDVKAGKQDKTQKGRGRFSLHRTTLDEALADGLYQRMCLSSDGEWVYSPESEADWRAELFDFYGDDAQEELLCVPKNSGGAYIGRQTIVDRMFVAPIVRWKQDDAFKSLPKEEREQITAEWCDENLQQLLAALPRERSHVFGEDFARVADLTVLAPGTIEQDLTKRVPFLVELRNMPFEQQAQIVFYILDRLPRFAGGAFDATGNGGYLAEVAAQRYGTSLIQEVKITALWYDEHCPPFKASFEDGTIWIPKDDDVLSDLRACQVIKGRPTLPAIRTGTNKQRHGDSFVALLMMDVAARMGAEIYELHSASFAPPSEYRSIMSRDAGGRRSDSRLIQTTAGIRLRHGGIL